MPKIDKTDLHEWLATLLTIKLENPEAKWLQDWINCLRFMCSCSVCEKRLRKTDLDVDLITTLVEQHSNKPIDELGFQEEILIPKIESELEEKK